MDITNEMIDALSPEDMLKIERLKQLKAKAEKDLFMIRDAYVFRMGEKWRRIGSTAYYDWVLFHDGTLKISGHKGQRCLQREPFEILLTKESLFELYVKIDECDKDPSKVFDSQKNYYNQFKQFLELTAQHPEYHIPIVNMPVQSAHKYKSLFKPYQTGYIGTLY